MKIMTEEAKKRGKERKRDEEVEDAGRAEE
jgi:hypothetical protein